MTDKTLLSKLDKVLVAKATTSFRPTNEQKWLKSQFWKAVEAAQLPSLPPTPNEALAAQYVALDGNWAQEGFPEWLWDQGSFDAQVDYLAQVALDELEKVLTSSRASDNVKLGAIKLSLEVAHRLGKQPEGAEFADEKIAKMSKAELEEYIGKSLKLVSGQPVDK